MEAITAINTKLKEAINGFKLNSQKLEELRNAHEPAKHLTRTSPDSMKGPLAKKIISS